MREFFLRLAVDASGDLAAISAAWILQNQSGNLIESAAGGAAVKLGINFMSHLGSLALIRPEIRSHPSPNPWRNTYIIMP